MKSNWRGHIITFLAIVLIICVFLYAQWARRTSGYDLPMLFGYGAAIVMSGSMEPTISVDDLVIIKETEDISVGDIIVYRSGKSLTVHRVIGKDGDTIVTQGDANNTADDPITVKEVVGKMVGSIPKAGILISMLRDPLVLAGLLLLILILAELFSVQENYKIFNKIDHVKKGS